MSKLPHLLADRAVGTDPVRSFGLRCRLVLLRAALGDVRAHRVGERRACGRHEDWLVERTVACRAVGAAVALPPHPIRVGVAGKVGGVIARRVLVADRDNVGRRGSGQRRRDSGQRVYGGIVQRGD